jgi:methionine synthase II (cobalamin-independent)
MFTASRNKPLLTTITGSLPRPSWFQSSLSGRTFSVAMSDLIFREQYTDALCTYVTDQARAGIDVLTDGDARFDIDVGGRAWFSYLFERMGGMGNAALRPQPWTSKREETPGDILHEVNKTRLPAIAYGDVTRGTLEHARIWKTAQRLTDRPVKIGTCCGQLLEAVVINEHYANRRELCLAIARALNEEYHDLADAGCPIIQLEEPLMHYVAEAKGLELDVDFYVQAFNSEVAGPRERHVLAFGIINDMNKLEDGKDVVVTSAVWHMDSALHHAIEAVRAHRYTAEDYRDWAMMAKGGTTLAPYYEFEDRIPPDVKAEVTRLTNEIVAGKYSVKIDDSEPKSSN